ncbi:hypothetical protein [Heliophilum fasciatum]|uniref:DUF4878 domain-containing protein n=1 Tax=Heliophilum fasciatum TaxID=35700 RepID=A0A4R2RIZ8_9FIRM|nr:hypothetical protein [Heliophilum fasciatum]MCW2278590.1 hypothetical protein [Heliophilum fasciatum]TCP62708.1 hypothetical protein EDD73_11956 [Heliophilum fasciatum]
MPKVRLFILALSLAAMLTACGDDTKFNASFAANQFVMQKLNASTGLAFQRFSEEQVTPLGDKRYQVVSFVDVPTATGETKRIHYTCIVKDSPMKWELEKLDTTP